MHYSAHTYAASFYSVSNVYKVVQSRKGSMLLALAMVLSPKTKSIQWIILIFRFFPLVYVTPIFVFSAISLRLVTCRSFDLVCLFKFCLLSPLTYSHYSLRLIGILVLIRDYLSPIDLIRNYPHLVVLGTGLAFGFLVVSNLVSKSLFIVNNDSKAEH